MEPFTGSVRVEEEGKRLIVTCLNTGKVAVIIRISPTEYVLESRK